jgi:hypothetical protein
VPAGPVAITVVDVPLQIVFDGNVKVGGVWTVTVLVTLTLQAPFVQVMVYTVVDDGLAVTPAPVVELKPVGGLQV